MLGRQDSKHALPTHALRWVPLRNKVRPQQLRVMGVVTFVVLLVFYLALGLRGRSGGGGQRLMEPLKNAADGAHVEYVVGVDGVLRVDPNGELLRLAFDNTVQLYDLFESQGHTDGNEKGDVILFCIPLRNAEPILPLMFKHLMNLTYHHDQIDLAFLVSDCSPEDRTLTKLFDYTLALQNGTLWDVLVAEEAAANAANSMHGTKDLYLQYMAPDYTAQASQAFQPPHHDEFTKPFRSIQIFQKDFGQVIGQGFSDRHDVKVQGIRRKLMGRARNWLVYNALRPYHLWVYWRDVDVEFCPGDVIQHLMKYDYDVIVPNVWRPLPMFLGNQQPYDLNLWQELEEALKLARTLDEDDVIVEGYAEYPTWRVHLAYLRMEQGNPDEIMDLDGVGGVLILAKAKVFRRGCMFPAFTFENHAETEAFGKMARKMGFRVGGLLHYTLWHIYEPSEDDLVEIARLERLKRRAPGDGTDSGLGDVAEAAAGAV